MARKTFHTLAAQVAILIASLAPAARAEVALGASFGYTHVSYSAQGLQDFKNDVFAIPGTESWGQPGVRVGYIAPGRRWDLNADIGLVHKSSTVFYDETTIEVLPQFQLNGRDRGGYSPFVNGGVGVDYATVPTSNSHSTGASRPLFGAGLGMRKSVSDGHGLIRIELRYDHLPEHVKETAPGSSIIFNATNMFSVKLGFDLLVGK
jgi:hypothetical protein